MAEAQEFYGTGRRKKATARVRLRHGNGEIIVNKRPLDVYFGREVLKTVDLSIATGELVAVVGPNGAGKSSVIRALA
ncbi:MAG: 30S ribosomal protein S9 [Deltaproteobacteria bacterium]|nr:MAG: 30S ribosomal protein S9 [Deltaproteobacteria bacterium]